MVKGSPEGLKTCLRAKISVAAKNKCLRDPVIYRCILQEHPLTKNKYKLYPTYDLACPIVDSLENVDLAMRTNEYADRNDQYNWFLKNLNLRKVKIYDYSRVNFVHSTLSKRHMKLLVENGVVEDYRDPRLPTV